MATAFVRGAQTMNSMFFKPIGRKGFHRKSSSPDTMRERVETESKDVKSNKNHVVGEATPWMLDVRTGIYYPKGHEKVLESIPDGGGDNDGLIQLPSGRNRFTAGRLEYHNLEWKYVAGCAQSKPTKGTAMQMSNLCLDPNVPLKQFL